MSGTGRSGRDAGAPMTGAIDIEIARERFPIAGTFRIARGARTVSEVLTVTLRRDGATGRGECLPYARYDETLDSVEAQVRGLSGAFADGLDRAALQDLLAPGAARNAIDCALWDLEAKARGVPAWRLAGLDEPGPVTTAYTLSIDAPEAMRVAASAAADRPLLKVKLGGEGGGEADLERLAAVREGAPGARLIVDANEGWSIDDYERVAPRLAALGVVLVEQPLPAADDAPLAGAARPVPTCADESCHDRASLDRLTGRYDAVNVKLDKAGGLTEALALAREARARGLGVMVGCMVGSSLAMAPAVLVAQLADTVDLDAPLLLAADREPALRYELSTAWPADPALWG